MEHSKFSALLLVLMLSISSFFHFGCACNACPKPQHPKKAPSILPPIIGKPPIIGPPVTLPPISLKPPNILPPISVKPPSILPPVTIKPPSILPPVTVKPPIILPPITLKPPNILPPIIEKPPGILPPIIGNPKIPAPPVTGTTGCPPPSAPAKSTCPVDTIKLGGFLDILGNVVQIGDPAVQKFCPLIAGLATLDAAACLCTTIKLKLLNVDMFLPIALELLATCGKTPPPGYACP